MTTPCPMEKLNKLLAFLGQFVVLAEKIVDLIYKFHK